MAGLYVHIPFCKSRCVYCAFYSTTTSGMAEKYVSALCREMDLRTGYCSPEWQTVYIGGGTPSTLPPDQLQRLFSRINCSHATEITIECNPDDVTPAFASLLASLPVNRVSMGAQTFDDSRLRFLRRRHGAADVSRAVDCLRAAGIDNISVDLIYGFPDETLDQWDADITAALSLNVEHLSAYCLSYEEGTPLYLMLQNDKVQQTDDDTCLAMYTMLMDTLSANGYEHYEISNFCLPGYRAIHNSSYWNDTPYLGFGAAAHSYNLLTRSWNVADIKEYVSAIESDNLPSESERIDDDTHYDDIITTAMRTCEGVDLMRLKPEYRNYALHSAKNDIDSGLLELADNHLRLTRKGLFVSDMVMSNLMKV